MPVESDKWKDGSMLEIYLDEAITAEMYVYAGTDRRNVTTVVQANDTVTIGAPVRVPVAFGGAIVVLQVDRTKNSAGSAGFSYQVDGIPYSWYEMYFVGLHWIHFWVFRVIVGILMLAVLAAIVAGPVGVFGVGPILTCVANSAVCVCLSSICIKCRRSCKRKPKKGKKPSEVQAVKLNDFSTRRPMVQDDEEKKPTKRNQVVSHLASRETQDEEGWMNLQPEKKREK